MENIIILRMHIISNALRYLETSIVTDIVIQINLKRMCILLSTYVLINPCHEYVMSFNEI